MTRTIVAIGGGEIKTKTTLQIDEYIANLAKKRAGEKRAVALFIGTASHDSLPYFNSFRKTYTSNFDIKADIALLTKKDIPMEHITEKIEKADLIYIGGGDTLYMLEVWEKTGMKELILDAYNRGVILSGLSAGAICWFEKIYTDSEKISGGEYVVRDGLGVLKGIMTPHFNLREEFVEVSKNYQEPAYAVEDNSALVFVNEELQGSLTAGGKAYTITNGIKKEVPEI